jgi:hypothetical protein
MMERIDIKRCDTKARNKVEHLYEFVELHETFFVHASASMGVEYSYEDELEQIKDGEGWKQKAEQRKGLERYRQWHTKVARSEIKELTYHYDPESDVWSLRMEGGSLYLHLHFETEAEGKAVYDKLDLYFFPQEPEELEKILLPLVKTRVQKPGKIEEHSLTLYNNYFRWRCIGLFSEAAKFADGSRDLQSPFVEYRHSIDETYLRRYLVGVSVIWYQDDEVWAVEVGIRGSDSLKFYSKMQDTAERIAEKIRYYIINTRA